MNAMDDHILKPEERPLILIVDDDPEILWVMVKALETAYQVREACDGSSGFEQALKYQPDLVVTDLGMPKMDGIELCRRLKTTPETAHIPVIILTGCASESSELKGLETGADDYLTKPFKLPVLIMRIHNMLKTRQQMRQRFSRDFMVPNYPEIESSPDQDFLRQAFALLEDHSIDPEFTVEQFAKLMNVSVRTLSRKLTALTDKTPSRIIWNVRLKKAAELLKSSDLRVSDIAYSVGYTDTSHFNRQFRQLYGMTPSAYRSKE